MKKMIILAFVAAITVGCAVKAPVEIPSGYPVSDVAAMHDKMDHENLVRAYIDLYPEISFMALYNSYIHEGSTNYNVGIMETSVDERHRVLTANSSTLYAVHPVNLKEEGGAVVLKVPAKTLGMINGPGWSDLADIGLLGEDKGAGGRYLITAPGWEGEVPAGMYHVKSESNNIIWLIRGFVVDGDWKGAAKYLRDNLETYPLRDADNRSETTFYNSSESFVDGGFMDMGWDNNKSLGFVAEYFINNGDTPHADKHVYIKGHLAKLGLFDGSIDPAKLAAANADGLERVRVLTFNNNEPTASRWEGSPWLMAISSADEFYNHKVTGDYSPIAHMAWSYVATFNSSAMVRPPEGSGSIYIATYQDNEGNYLNGANHYLLEIPANVPHANFWSFILYDAVDRSMVKNSTGKYDVASDATDAPVMNEDGTITIHMSPVKPAGVPDSNWIETNEGEGTFPFFRIYSPTAAYYDNSWVLPPITIVK
jgi:hypothetical protein